MYRKENFGGLAVLLLFYTIFAYDFGDAHSGRTDANGGHYNRKTGEYHYHGGGNYSNFVPQRQVTSRKQSPVQRRAIATANIDVKHNVKRLSWCLAGAGCGVVSFTYAVLDTPQVPAMRLLGESPAYIEYYTAEYQSKVKDERVTYTCLGWGTTSLMLSFLYLVSVGAD